MINLVETKYANLKPEQLQELKLLEEKLEVTLLAYEYFGIEGEPPQGNNSNIINPS